VFVSLQRGQPQRPIGYAARTHGVVRDELRPAHARRPRPGHLMGDRFCVTDRGPRDPQEALVELLDPRLALRAHLLGAAQAGRARPLEDAKQPPPSGPGPIAHLDADVGEALANPFHRPGQHPHAIDQEGAVRGVGCWSPPPSYPPARRGRPRCACRARDAKLRAVDLVTVAQEIRGCRVVWEGIHELLAGSAGPLGHVEVDNAPDRW
jgi:hypothetical protein